MSFRYKGQFNTEQKGLSFLYIVTTTIILQLQINSCFSSFSFIDTKQLVSWMRGHEGAVSSISVHSSGRYAITTSSDTAQLWDLDTFQRKRKLNIRQSVGIQKVNMRAYQVKCLSMLSCQSTVFK